MGRARRYPLLVTVPPFVVGTLLAISFLARVVQLPVDDWFWIGAAYVVYFVVGIAVFAWSVGAKVGELEELLGRGETKGIGAEVSACLLRSEIASFVLWVIGGPLFGVAVALVVMPTFRGMQRFVEAAFILVVPAMAWSYWFGKARLLAMVADVPGVRYEGLRFSFGSKIAMVFAGFFLVSTGALVILVTSRVSTSLATYAVRAQEGLYARLSAEARESSASPNDLLARLGASLPPGFSLHLIESSGHVASRGGTLSPSELRRIRLAHGGGGILVDGAYAVRFGEIGHGAKLAMGIPVENEAVADELQGWAIVLALITSLIFAVATWFLVRDLTAPVRTLMKLSEDMSRGDFTAEEGVFSDDEIGLLAEALLVTRDSLERLIGRVSASGTAVTAGVRVMGGGTNRLLNGAEQQTSLAERATSAVEEIRAGARSVLHAADQVASLTQDSAGRATELRSSAQEVARSIDNLFRAVESISSATIQIDASAKESSKRVDFLTRVTEQVLSFVSQMDATVEQFQATSGETAVMANGMLDAAATGGAAVDETVEGIHRAQDATGRSAEMLDQLDRSIEQVGVVLGVIDELADRTNLLSLNAAIIAAQAGEHEQGFSVVAEEIRELADRTRNSTREIGGIIKSIRTAKGAAVDAMRNGVSEVARSVALAAKASGSLGEIRDNAEKTHGMAKQVSQALGEHAEASRHLLEVTSRMSDDVVAIQKAAEDQAGATRDLAEQSETVRDIAKSVLNAAGEQVRAARGISEAMEQIASDSEGMRDHLEQQLGETEKVATASESMLEIAKRNDSIAHEFNEMLQGLEKSGGEFENEYGRFRLRE